MYRRDTISTGIHWLGHLKPESAEYVLVEASIGKSFNESGHNEQANAFARKVKRGE